MVRNIEEYYSTRQGRPYAQQEIDLESGRTLSEISSGSLREEYVEVKELLDKLLNEEIQKVQQIVIELQQIKLHLASMSQEDISEKDVEG